MTKLSIELQPCVWRLQPREADLISSISSLSVRMSLYGKHPMPLKQARIMTLRKRLERVEGAWALTRREVFTVASCRNCCPPRIGGRR